MCVFVETVFWESTGSSGSRGCENSRVEEHERWSPGQRTYT